MKILILDDDKICRRVNSEGLRRAGYDTLEAASAKEAFEFLENGEPIVMILTDMMMPEVSGLDFLARLRSDAGLSKIPVMISTCLEPSLWLEKAQALGISGYSPKPINANHLRGKVGKILQEESWPLAEVFSTLTRLDITAEGYFECVDDFIKQLEDLVARTNGSTEAPNRDQLTGELAAASGAAANLGAQRITTVLEREIENIKKIAPDQKIVISPSVKRETAMLKLASLILKKENEEAIAARKVGRVVARQSGSQSRWKAELVKQVAATADAPAAVSTEANPPTSTATSAASEAVPQEPTGQPIVTDQVPAAVEAESKPAG
ncbi:MAG: response regulator [Candidatus Acidiferrales bacterium]